MLTMELSLMDAQVALPTETAANTGRVERVKGLIVGNIPITAAVHRVVY